MSASSGTGLQAQVGNNVALDVSGRFQFISKIEDVAFNNIGFRVGLLFGLNPPTNN